MLRRVREFSQRQPRRLFNRAVCLLNNDGAGVHGWPVTFQK